jgi:hypothetical protein
VRDRLRGEGVDEKLGGINRHMSVHETVAAFQDENASRERS